MEAAEKTSQDLTTQETIWFGKERENSHFTSMMFTYMMFTCFFHMILYEDSNEHLYIRRFVILYGVFYVESLLLRKIFTLLH
jgi:hypothetical protein